MLSVITLVLLAVVSFSTVSSYSEYPSPLQQIKNDVAPEDIQCNTDRVHAVRDNDKHVCVSEQTAEKRGWEVIPKPVVENPPVVENTDSVAISEQIQVNKSNTDSGLTTIPNPTGYWTPIIEKDQRDEFVDKILQITGHHLVEDYGGGNRHYTDGNADGKGIIKPRIVFETNTNTPTIGNFYIFPNVSYLFYLDGSLSDKEMDEYVTSFMQKSGWEYTDDQFSKHGGEEHAMYHYHFQSEYGDIQFRANTFWGMTEVWFAFGGWTNNPELVPKEFPLSHDDAINKVQQYVADYDLLHVPHDQFERRGLIQTACEFEFLDNPYVKERIEIIAGVPYYNVDVGECSYRDHTGMAHHAILLIDAWQGQDIIHTVVKGLD